MPVSNQGMSAMSGLSLFMAALVFAYLNSTTSSLFWSPIYMGGVGVCSLAAASRLATAVGVSNMLARVLDYVSSWVPFVSVAGVVLQMLRYNQPDVSGFMAGFAFLTFIFLIVFGVTDAVRTWFGHKYQSVSVAAAEASARVHAAQDALHGSR